MKLGFKMTWAFGCGLALLQLTAAAQDKAGATNAPINGLKDQKEKMSYAIGMDIGSNLKRTGVELDLDLLTGAVQAYIFTVLAMVFVSSAVGEAPLEHQGEKG